ncbi:unnamed protein product [Dicrocoelium dendriticum]|nr:unnamed protein product [Dicrocoelium dendriticum]
MPIGLRLDALAAGGQDGCRVLQVLKGGAIHFTGVLHPNDYITSLNGTSMRNMTNLEVFNLLKSLDTCDSLEISFLPADVVKKHRSSHLGPERLASLLNGPTVNANNSWREAKAWNGTMDEIVLNRHLTERTWGLELSGTAVVLPPPVPPYPMLDNPTFVASIVPNSPADRIGLQPGDLILKIDNQDVSNLGPKKASDLLRQQAESEARQLRLGVRYCTSTPPYPVAPGKSERQLVVVDVEPGPKPVLLNHQITSPRQSGPTSPLSFDRVRADKLTGDSSLSSSQLEAPEPLSELDSRDELNVLSRPIRASVGHMNGGLVVDSGEESANLALISGPVLDDDVSPSVNVDYRQRSPPTPPPRLFSSGSIPFSIDQDLLNLPDVEDDPVTLYTRTDPPGDRIVTVPISLPPTSATVSSSSRVETLGIRLVMGRLPESRSTYVAGLTPGSLAANQNILRVGDEIVQVERKDVRRWGHLAVRQFIHRLLLEKTSADTAPTDVRTISLVVRRNPINLQQMAIPTVQERTPAEWDWGTPQPLSNHVGENSPLDAIDGGSVSQDMLEKISKLLNEPLDLFEIFNLSLKRNENGYGIFIVNYGPNDTPGIFVSELPPDGAAAMQGALRPFDRILAVNGEIQQDYDATLQLMKQSASQVRLTVARRRTPMPPAAAAQPVATSSPAPPPGPPTALLPPLPNNPIIPGQATLIELVRGAGSSLGFSIVGGKDTLLGDILVHSIREDGVAAADGRLHVGDRLWAINDVDLRGADHIIAKHLIQSARDNIRLLVYRDPPSFPDKSAEPELVRCVLDRAPGQSLGLSLISRSPYGPGTAIGSVLEGTPAEHCGQFQPRDVLVEVNGVDVRLAQTQEVVSMLKNATGSVSLVVERQPDSKRPLHPPREPVCRLQLYLVALCRPGSGAVTHAQASQSSVGFIEPLLGSSNAEGSFGLFLRQATEEEITEAGGQLIVDDIAPGSPAALSVMIKPGDRLLSVDREPVDWLQPEEVFQLLAGMSQCTLELGRIPIPPYPVDPGLSMACYPNDQPPYPTITDGLPPMLSGVMPTVQTDVRFIDAVEEEQEDHGLPVTEHTQNAYGLETNEDHSESISSGASSVLVREAVAKAESATGFQVKQFYLPPAVPDKSLGLRLTKGPGIGGAIVVSLEPASVAAEVGLRVGDRILGLDSQLLLAQEPGTSSRMLLKRIDDAWRHRGDTRNNPVSLTVITASASSELRNANPSLTVAPKEDAPKAPSSCHNSTHSRSSSGDPLRLHVMTDDLHNTEQSLGLADSPPDRSDEIYENEPSSVVTSSDQPMISPASESHSTEPASSGGVNGNCESPDSGVDAELLNSLHASVERRASDR